MLYKTIDVLEERCDPNTGSVNKSDGQLPTLTNEDTNLIYINDTLKMPVNQSVHVTNNSDLISKKNYKSNSKIKLSQLNLRVREILMK